ncbi:MAG: hypothetical protein A2V81_01240 [Candidatus Abawacabacteria bacterium RBG_16_42_10]|uniref:Uncharacterized protein n=1 Tax=Candidatus Abawacabacteria bacterium RBG_16_42_10 TaxID=1817814 RepID=A0A1F4XIS9_9BACT|nr:MAG: hypothetical protein A2V81_01240 [Candidatus Abawacabacteria bacterium RBG_16_42_10]
MFTRKKLAAFAIANLLALPLMSGLVHAQVTTSQDRTVVTLDVTNECTVRIMDTPYSAFFYLGQDQDYHTQGDLVANETPQDGFDQVTPSPTRDFSDNDFSNLTLDAPFSLTSSNIVVDDPTNGNDEGIGQGYGYVDLEPFDLPGNQYAAQFNAEVDCDTVNGYDLHIADTFNLETTIAGVATVDYCANDIYNSFGPCDPSYTSYNVARREGLFRIAPDSLRDLDQATASTAEIKHEYIMDLPTDNNFSCTATMTDDNNTGKCPPAGLDPFGFERLRPWPYTIGTPPADTNFGTVGFTILCDEDGGDSTAAFWPTGHGRIDPFTRGIAAPDPDARFRYDTTFDESCDDADAPDEPEERYAAIPSLVDGEDYMGITGTDPGTYAAILSADNWVGYSGTIDPANLNSDADNFFEVRSAVPNNQIAGTYAGTIILSCLPNLTAEPELDFDGPFGTPAWTGDDTTN